MARARLDCVVVGYNETPFERYESILRQYGEESEAYRDLKFSFVDVGDARLTYPELMNYAVRAAGGGDRLAFRSGEIPNLAAAYLVNYLRRQGCAARYVNLFQDEKEAFAEYLREEPLCVAITTTFYVLNLPVTEMVEFIRKHSSRTRIVVGGPLVSNHLRNYQGPDLEAALNDMGADAYVVDAQGEATLARIVACLKSGGDLADVPNLVVAENGSFRFTPRELENNSLDENHIDWRLFAGERPGPTIQTRTARSCAFSCSFCNYPARAGALTLAGLDTIARELDSIREIGARNVVFIDDTFNVPLNRFKEICRLMIDRGYGFDWFSYLRCSNADEEAFDLAAESGCKGVFLGIESGSPTILKNMNKAARIDQYERGIRRLRERGILSFGSFIAGFPGETEETIAETLDFIRGTGCDYYRIQSWYCERGTPIERQRDKYDIDGDGFVWSHATMDSMEAMDHIERMFLSIEESTWLPQWSFDFWIIPYLLGKGISLLSFREFMGHANKLLALGIATLSEEQRAALRREHLDGMMRVARTWLGSIEGRAS
jgi:radical SAM PhpK family P-methyltransferase